MSQPIFAARAAAPARSQARSQVRSSAIPQPRPPQAASDLIAFASRTLSEASVAATASQRYAYAYVAALRAAAALLAVRAQPSRGRPRSAWLLLPRVAPEFAEWARFFAACSAKRVAAESGSRVAVSTRESDDMLRDAGVFVMLVAEQLGIDPQVPLRSVGA